MLQTAVALNDPYIGMEGKGPSCRAYPVLPGFWSQLEQLPRYGTEPAPPQVR